MKQVINVENTILLWALFAVLIDLTAIRISESVNQGAVSPALRAGASVLGP
jgi:hypothetical protein